MRQAVWAGEEQECAESAKNGMNGTNNGIINRTTFSEVLSKVTLCATILCYSLLETKEKQQHC